MPSDGTIGGLLVGKLDVLRIECPTCGRQGHYHVARLLAQLGPAARLIAWPIKPFLGQAEPPSILGRADTCPALSSHCGECFRITVAHDPIAPGSLSGVEARVRALHELSGRLSMAELRHSNRNRNLSQ